VDVNGNQQAITYILVHSHSHAVWNPQLKIALLAFSALDGIGGSASLCGGGMEVDEG
jgi:hypothetical protein